MKVLSYSKLKIIKNTENLFNLISLFYHLSILDHFPSGMKARDMQKEILNEVQQYLKSDYKTIIISAPTGVGKSAIGVTLAQSYGSSFVVTASKHLQAQYANDFENLWPVMGKSNFPCYKTMSKNELNFKELEEAMKLGYTCDKGECEEKNKDGKTSFCEFKPTIGDFQAKAKQNLTFGQLVCPYYEQKFAALISKHSVWNYSSYFQIVKYNQRSYGDYLKRAISIFDEAHSIEDQIIQFIGIDITEKYVDESKVNIESYDLSDIKEIAHLLDDMADFYARAEKEYRDSRAFELKPDYDKLSKLDQSFQRFLKAKIEIEAKPENFIINQPFFTGEKFKSVSIKPLDISEYIQQFLVTPFQIFMSATIDKDSFCEIMGFSSDKVAMVDTLHSPFPMEHRKIEFLNTARLSYNTTIENEQKIISKIDEILSKHKDERGIILTSSKSRCKNIKAHLSPENKRRIRICHARNKNGKTQDQVIKEHAESKNGVLLSSSLWQGVDLKDDLSRFQIIAKVPYPNYTEKWVAAKRKRYPRWYISQTLIKLLQGFGRSIRNQKDWAVTYVLDSAVQRLLSESRSMVPKAYHDVLKW